MEFDFSRYLFRSNMHCCGGGGGEGPPPPPPVPPGRELGRLTADLRTRSLLLHEIDAVVTVRLVDVAVRGATDLPAVGGHEPPVPLAVPTRKLLEVVHPR